MGKTLRADIIVGGKADSSFYQLGNTLENLGQTVNQISEKLIQFGKESVEAYTSYEDYMLDAEVALRTQYDSTNELSKAMEQLDKAAMQWARDSRFTTEDVAGAISNASRRLGSPKDPYGRTLGHEDQSCGRDGTGGGTGIPG